MPQANAKQNRTEPNTWSQSRRPMVAAFVAFVLFTFLNACSLPPESESELHQRFVGLLENGGQKEINPKYIHSTEVHPLELEWEIHNLPRSKSRKELLATVKSVRGFETSFSLVVLDESTREILRLVRTFRDIPHHLKIPRSSKHGRMLVELATDHYWGYLKPTMLSLESQEAHFTGFLKIDGEEVDHTSGMITLPSKFQRREWFTLGQGYLSRRTVALSDGYVIVSFATLTEFIDEKGVLSRDLTLIPHSSLEPEDMVPSFTMNL